MTRRIVYISGTRADYGLMRNTLRSIDRHPFLTLDILVCGMHLDPTFGLTMQEVKNDGFSILGEVSTHHLPRSGAGMARGIGLMTDAFTQLLETRRPELVLLLGDRGEMLAGAIAALHLNIPIAHIHGGERSGTVDEPVRHAISKLAHLHLVATCGSRDRLVAMGERLESVHMVGAPGLDGLHETRPLDRSSLTANADLDANVPIALMVYHPVLQEAEIGGEIARNILRTLRKKGVQVVALKPNADGGSDRVVAALEEHSGDAGVSIFTHLPRENFISWMAAADFMIGNSSAGIIEAASFGTPVVNVGSRQNLRERNANVIDCGNATDEIDKAVAMALALGRSQPTNVYGEGATGPQIAALLKEVDLSSLLWKCNAY